LELAAAGAHWGVGPGADLGVHAGAGTHEAAGSDRAPRALPGPGKAAQAAAAEADRIEIALPDGTCIRVGADVGLALQVQQALERDPYGGDLYIFRSRRGDLVKCLWHDDTGRSLYVKRLERGRFVWPQARKGVVSLTSATLCSSAAAAPGQ
jgi:transposase